MDVNITVANNLKRIRESRKLTLDVAANITGVSRSMLAQIEKGDVNPTISVLWKIANGFKVSFTSLLENSSEISTIIPCEDIKPLIEDGGLFINYPTFSFDETKLFECYRIVIEPKGQMSSNPHLLGTEEYITVFAGELIINIEESEYILKKGDSMRFKADVAHSYKNVKNETVEISMLIYYNE